LNLATEAQDGGNIDFQFHPVLWVLRGGILGLGKRGGWAGGTGFLRFLGTGRWGGRVFRAGIFRPVAGAEGGELAGFFFSSIRQLSSNNYKNVI